MIRSIQFCFSFFGILCCLGLAGCGEGGGVVPVKGNLTIGGQPADGVVLTLQPADPKDAPATGTVTKGSFELHGPQGQNGRAPGKYKVILQMAGASAQAAAESYKKGGGPPQAPKAIFPSKYSKGSSSDKEVEVKSGSSLTIDIPGE